MIVLLVDDEEELVSTLAERLSFRGIEADWFTNGAEAILSAKDKAYDIAVLDIKMPGISGIELGKKIKAIHLDIKIIFCTGHGSAAYFSTASVQCGEEYYLAKPIDINSLIEKINKLTKD